MITTHAYKQMYATLCWDPQYKNPVNLDINGT